MDNSQKRLIMWTPRKKYYAPAPKPTNSTQEKQNANRTTRKV